MLILAWVVGRLAEFAHVFFAIDNLEHDSLQIITLAASKLIAIYARL